MCGIAGFCTRKEGLPLTQIIGTMTDALVHRGRDDQGVAVFDEGVFGHRRLSIIDLSAGGHQPMWYHPELGAWSAKHHPELAKHPLASQAIVIAFNGEIYNYQDLKVQLQAMHYVFTTNSDTEVILASYWYRGTACFTYFNGMRACAIHDPRVQELIVSRDIVGKKPLYRYHDEHTFAFASELKAFVALADAGHISPLLVDHTAVEDYFSFGYIPAPASIYSSIQKLPPRTLMRIDLSTMRVADQHTYFTLPEYTPLYNWDVLVQQGKDLLADAVRLRMIADVPVGTFLSGGLDSSAVTAQMKRLYPEGPLHTFSVGFEGKAYDETSYITQAQEHIGTMHHHTYFRQADFDQGLQQFAFSYDEPLRDFSGFPTHQVCALAKPFVTVVLSGDGGDEIFAGYNSHLAGRRLDMLYHFPTALRRWIARIPVQANLNSFVNPYLLVQACKLSLYPKNQFYAQALANDMLKTEHFIALTTERLDYALQKGGGMLAEALRIYDLLFNTLDNNFLVKVDRASMAHGVEVRCPFLDKRFLTYAQTIPTSYKLSLFRTKKLMRSVIADLLPPTIINRGKQGFLPPVAERIDQPAYAETLQFGKALLEQQYPAISRFYDGLHHTPKNTLHTTYKIKLFLFALRHKQRRK